MFISLNSDILLANLLTYSKNPSNGISIDDIELYCVKIKEDLKKSKKSGYIAFHISRPQLKMNITFYPDFFVERDGKYFKGDSFDINCFEAVLEPETGELLKKVATAI